jgi:hypothetical protein
MRLNVKFSHVVVQKDENAKTPSRERRKGEFCNYGFGGEGCDMEVLIWRALTLAPEFVLMMRHG